MRSAAGGGAARAEATLENMGMTAEQKRLYARLWKLQEAEDWLGVVTLEREAQVMARELRARNPRLAGKINSVVGNGFQETGDYARSRELHEAHRAICEELGDREGLAAAYCNLGNCYECTGDYARAMELHEQCRVMSEALGDRAWVARAWTNMGNCYSCTGDYARARELHEQRMAMAEEMGDRAGVAAACANLGCCYFATGDYARARELHEKDRAICEALGDRAGVATACGNIGICYHGTGDYGRARALLEQQREMGEELGDRAGVARACGNLGLCHLSTGDYERARELHEERRAAAEAMGDRAGVAMALANIGNCSQRTGDHLGAREMHEASKAICEEIGDRQGVASACGNIGECYLHSGDYGRSISHFTQQYELAKEMKVVPGEATAALGAGVALRLEVRASVRARDASGSALPGPPGLSEDAVREAEKWLQTALDLGRTEARLHLAHLTFDAGQEASALQYLQDYLSWCVEGGRNQCAGCDQTRGEDAPMLTCGCCLVARFCSVEHQKMASKSVASGGSLLKGRHRDVCHVLGRWRQHVVKESASPEVLREDLLAFLRK